MGFRFNNHCYVDSLDALSAFNDSPSVTLFSSGNLKVLTNFNTSIDSNGLIIYSIKDETNTTLTTNITKQLPICDDTKPIQIEQVNVLLIFWAILILGVITGFSASKQSTKVQI